MDVSLKMAAGVALMAGCTLLGRGMSLGQQKRARCLEETIRGLQALERGICLRRVRLAQALRESASAVLVQTGERLTDTGRSPEDVWEEERSAWGKNLLPEDLEILDRVVFGLGKGEIIAQKEMLEDARAALEGRRQQACKRQEETGRLYPALGALTGLALAVLLY